MSRRAKWACGVLVLALVALAMPVRAALIVNRGFEQPVVTHPDQFQYYYAGDSSITGWTIIGGSVDILKFTRWTPHEGNNSLDLTGVTTGGIYQDIATVAGEQYHLSFWIAGNPEFGGGPGGPVVKSMKLSWAGAAVATLNASVAGKTNQNPGWTQYSYDLTALGSNTRIQFESLTGGFSGMMLDDLSLTSPAPPVDPGPSPAPLPPALFSGVLVAGTLGVVRARRKGH
jgi:choice-of-anchor C domain-containing protein